MVAMTKDADGGDRAPFHGGGNASMHPKTPTGTQKPGVGSQEGSGGGFDPGAGAQAGSSSVIGYSTGATNKDHAGTQIPGYSCQGKSDNPKWAEGGKTPMFGNRGSLPAKGGCSAP